MERQLPPLASPSSLCCFPRLLFTECALPRRTQPAFFHSPRLTDEVGTINSGGLSLESGYGALLFLHPFLHTTSPPFYDITPDFPTTLPVSFLCEFFLVHFFTNLNYPSLHSNIVSFLGCAQVFSILFFTQNSMAPPPTDAIIIISGFGGEYLAVPSPCIFVHIRPCFVLFLFGFKITLS